MSKKERLQKILAQAGKGSRRECEELIREGRVTVDGAVIMAMGTQWEPGAHHIKVDGKAIHSVRKYYLVFNKPRGVLCHPAGEDAGNTYRDYLPNQVRDLVRPALGLDVQASGAVILTNDGELANRIAHPRYNVMKVYLAKTEDRVTDEQLEALRTGVWLEDGRAAADRVTIRERKDDGTMLEIAIRETRPYLIRRMIEQVGQRLRRLTRIRIGDIEIDDLGSGAHRPMTPEEIDKFLRDAKPEPKPRPNRRDRDRLARASGKRAHHQREKRQRKPRRA